MANFFGISHRTDVELKLHPYICIQCCRLEYFSASFGTYKNTPFLVVDGSSDTGNVEREVDERGQRNTEQRQTR